LSKNTFVVKNEIGENFISLYNGYLTDEILVQGILKIKSSFPALPVGFYDVFMERIKDKGFSDSRLIDSINYVIDTCIYPTPTMANFLNFDKRKRLYTYNELLNLVDSGDSFKYYEIKEINSIKWWVKKNE